MPSSSRIRPVSRSYFSRASASVRPMKGATPGMIRMWSGLRPTPRAGLDVAIELLGGAQVLMGGEDHFGRCRGKAASVVGMSGLHDHWMALGGTRNIERAPSP